VTSPQLELRGKNQSQILVDFQTQTFNDSYSNYYLHLLDNPDIMFVTCIPNEDNYRTWRKAMENALHAKNKISFINGTLVESSPHSPGFSI